MKHDLGCKNSNPMNISETIWPGWVCCKYIGLSWLLARIALSLSFALYLAKLGVLQMS